MTGLVTHDFPSLDVMRGRWALTAAIETAVLGGFDRERTRADADSWYYADGGGSWARLMLFDEGRAALTGIDRDHSETYRAQVDPGLGVPSWAQTSIPPALGGNPTWLGFVVFFDGETWRSYDHGVADGLEQHLLPVLSEERMLQTAADWFEGAFYDLPGDNSGAPESVDAAAVRRAVELGPELTEEALRAVLPFEGAKLAAGVTAARSFYSRSI